MQISEEKKQVARATLAVFGGQPQVAAFQDQILPDHRVDILTVQHSPEDGVHSYGTIGLLDMDIGFELDGKPLRLELVGACREQCDFFDRLLATCSFLIMNRSGQCGYGEVFQNLVHQFDSALAMQHITFLTAESWSRPFEAIEMADRTVTWLMAIPVSDAEAAYVLEHGPEALEALFAEKGVDRFDMYRESAV